MKNYSIVKCTKGGTINGHTFKVNEEYPMLGWNNGHHLVYENEKGDVEELILLDIDFQLTDSNEIVKFSGNYRQEQIKKFTKLLLPLIIGVLIGICATNLNFYNTEIKLDKYTCDESGVCAEGLEYTIGHDKFIINKETCLQHNKKWNEKLKACYMY